MTLDQDDVEAIAQRIVELLEPAQVGLIDARELAEQLGVTREWVYANAARLGAVRLGAGPKSRLRFDIQRAQAAIAETDQAQRPPQRAPRRRERSRKASDLNPGATLLRGRSG